mmetsp:Transcript_105273/g.267492  ORF Transcript_105273/g.267492 Transcript_105273/m.267492 type:complete len:290 (+) Transcript_105273:330-1199(+)
MKQHARLELDRERFVGVQGFQAQDQLAVQVPLLGIPHIQSVTDDASDGQVQELACPQSRAAWCRQVLRSVDAQDGLGADEAGRQRRDHVAHASSNIEGLHMASNFLEPCPHHVGGVLGRRHQPQPLRPQHAQVRLQRAPLQLRGDRLPGGATGCTVQAAVRVRLADAAHPAQQVGGHGLRPPEEVVHGGAVADIRFARGHGHVHQTLLSLREQFELLLAVADGICRHVVRHASRILVILALIVARGIRFSLLEYAQQLRWGVAVNARVPARERLVTIGNCELVVGPDDR